MAEPEKTDATKSKPLPWVVLSGLLGLYAVGATPAPPPSPPAPKDAPSAAAKHEPERPAKATDNPLLKPVEEFFATHDGRWSPDDLAKEVHGYHTEFLIATVPDPLDSPFGYSFDQVVDAVQRGVQQKNGYLLDRAWLPWEVDRASRVPTTPPKTPTNLRETTPGVLLFRHGKDEKKGITKPGLCVVLLVGETPLGGVQKQAFWKALELIAGSGYPQDEPVRIVGPYFTGSQTSLQFVLRDWFNGSGSGTWKSWLSQPPKWRPQKFHIVFGNASAIRTKEFFRGEWGPEKLRVGATVVPARVQLNAVLHFLAHRDAARSTDAIVSQVVDQLPDRLAILAESNTGFGKQFAAYGEKQDVVVLRFPLHVSRLKSEYAQAFRKQDEKAGLPATMTISAAGFEEAGGAAEGVPAQGGAATTAANNAVLANILSTVSRERFRYVGVMATDARDKLFLIRLVREYCPDTHVFVTDADVLLTHPDYRYHMKGVVVGSTYPLYPPNQQWVNPKAPERLLLSSSAAQGYYNATLAVLGEHEKMLEYGPPSFATGEGVPNDRPPVWVSMVAPNGTLVPLQVFTGYEDQYGYVWVKPAAEPPPPAEALRYPGTLYVTGLVLAGFWLVLAGRCWGGQGFWSRGQTTGIGVFRTVLLGAQMVFAVAIVALASARAELSGFTSAEDHALMGTAGLAWVAFLLLALRGVAFRRTEATGPESRRAWRWTLVNLALIAALVAFAALFLHRFWMVSDRPHRALFFARAVDLASGLSPLTPLFLMCAAVSAVAYFQVQRYDLARRNRVPSPFPADPDRLFDALSDQDRRLKVEMTPGRFWKRHRWPLTALFVGLVGGTVTVWRQSLPTVEGVVWDGLFATGFVGVYALAALTVLQTVVLWRHTKQLLACVASLPMTRVFARLPAKVSAVVTRYLYTRSAQPMLLQMGAHQLRQLADAAAADPDAPQSLRELGPAAGRVEAKLQEYINPAHGKAGDPADEEALRQDLAEAASQGLAALAPRWKSLPTDEAFGGLPATAPAAEPAWVAKTEELVATQLVSYLGQFLIQLRSLMLAVLVCSSLLLVAATSYPFHPERLLLVFLLGLVGAGVGSVVYVLLDMSRDETVGRVASASGRLLDSGFLAPFLTYVVPTLGVLAAQLSGTFRWALEPILRVVK